MRVHAETFQFQAETKQLLDLVIHSLYTTKDIFLRELISNASDALDRLRFEAITRPELLDDDEKLAIRLDVDRELRTLTISDNGIGMSREEVIANIGTIAKSGTRELRERLNESGSGESVADLIGQFGVGFYAAFMVSDQVTLVTRPAGEQVAVRWESSGDGTFTLTEDEKSSRGTLITLRLKPADPENGIEDYTDVWTLERIVKQYSDFIAYPVVVKSAREEPERDEKGEVATGDARATVVEDKVLNSMKPIWARAQSEVTEAEYHEFYKHLAHDWTEPLKVIPMKAEGRFEYRALVFIPSRAPFDMFSGANEGGLRLYAKGVLVMERCDTLLPRYLRFVKGVVDSADLPLNVSRQTLQQDFHVTQIRKGVTKKVLDTLQAMRENDAERYATFWEQFGAILKEGMTADGDNRARLVPLLLFESSQDPEKRTTLKEYVERMKEGQNEIYYLTGASRRVVENSPHLEALRAKGYEVLYLIDPVDEFVIEPLGEYDGKKLKSAGKGVVGLGDEQARERAEKDLKEKEAEYTALLAYLQKTLDKDVKEVRLSGRLTTSPACLVGSEHDMSPYLERLIQTAKGEQTRRRRILELNPDHEIVSGMYKRFGEDAHDPMLAEYATLLLGHAFLAEGSELPDPVEFNRVLAQFMARQL
jgi:molecular chaperone HtpG